MLRIGIEEALGSFQVRLVRAKTFFNDRICTFADDKDLIFRRSDNHSHSLTRRIELDQIEKLVLADAVPGITNHVVVLITLTEEEAQVPCTIDQGELVRTRGIIDDILNSLRRLLNVSDDGMAKAEGLMEALQVLAVLMRSIIDVVVVLLVLKVDISDARWILDGLWIIFTVLKLSSRESLELHDVLSKRTSLITEDVVHHA